MMAYTFDRRVDLLKPLKRKVSATGERSTEYKAINVAARLVRSRGTVGLEDLVEVPAKSIRYIIRFRSDISAAWKVRIGGLFYDIATVGDVENTRRRAYLQLTLERTRKPLTVKK